MKRDAVRLQRLFQYDLGVMLLEPYLVRMLEH